MADNQTLITRGPSLVRWSPVFAGAVAGFGTFVLLTTLWIAWAWNDLGGGGRRPTINNAWIQNNLEWLIVGSGVFAMLLAGFIAGWFGGLRGTGVGGLNGFITWGLMATGAVLLGTPSLLGIQGIAGGTTVSFQHAWGPFWTLVAGLGAAVIGGAMGGATKRPPVLFEPQAVEVLEITGEGTAVSVARPRLLDVRDETQRVAGVAGTIR